MPQVKDAPVILAGQVISNTIKTDRASGEFKGRKVTVMVPGVDEPGFAIVNFSAEEAAVYNPADYDRVAWYVRSAPYSVEGNNGMSTRFIRAVSEDDLDKLHSGLPAVASSK